MKTYEEALKLARETGNGVTARFQEKPTHKMARGFDCPHCGAYHGSKKENKWNTQGTQIGDRYETPEDIEFMCGNEDSSYSWTEDMKCSDCGEMYCRSNGC